MLKLQFVNYIWIYIVNIIYINIVNTSYAVKARCECLIYGELNLNTNKNVS